MSWKDNMQKVEDYLNRDTWKVNENSNVGYSFSALQRKIAGETIEKFTLNKIYNEEIAKAHRSGDFHIHDLDYGIAGYCAGWSLEDLLLKGFGNVGGQSNSKPPKHFDTALLQSVNFIGTLQNEWAGAQAWNSMDTYMAPFIRDDGLTYPEVKQGVQKLIYNLNVTSRWGNQTPFTNITLDWTVPEDLKNQHVIIGGERQSRTYQDYQEEMNMFNKAFLEVMKEGDADGRPFTFPIPTYNITDDFHWDNTNTDLLFEVTAKYGTPYFSNFISSDMETSDVRSMCCRLRLDQRELEKNVTGGLFGSSDKTGSQGVVTINMPRLGYVSDDEDEFRARLERVMTLARESLEIKRDVVEENIERGLMPYTKSWLGGLNRHFSTIGLVGMNEACLNLFGRDIAGEEQKKFSEDILDFMLYKLQDFQEETGTLYNLEASPAEGTSYRLARKDKDKFGSGIKDATYIGSEDGEPYYTNSTQLPVYQNTGIFDEIEHQEDLQTKYTGGTVLHLFLGEQMQGEGARTLLERVFSNSQIPYFTFTPTYSICKNHGYIEGEEPKCPECGEPTEVYSRVVGYYRPVQNWNKGKKEEFSERKYFEVPK